MYVGVFFSPARRGANQDILTKWHAETLTHGFSVSCEIRWFVLLLFSLSEETTDETKRERDGTR